MVFETWGILNGSVLGIVILEFDIAEKWSLIDAFVHHGDINTDVLPLGTVT